MSLEWILLGLRILATIILYTFLGIAFYLIWQNLKQATSLSPLNYHLRVVAANRNVAWRVGDVLPLRPITLLGSDTQNTIILPEPSISASHARLCQTGGVWWLEDLGSDSGTLLNELPLSHPTPLADGDIIGLGSLRFKLEAAPGRR